MNRTAVLVTGGNEMATIKDNNGNKVCICNQDCINKICVASDSGLVVRKCWCAECKDYRKEAKAKKDFVTSDTIRNELIKLGVQLKDEKDGSVSYSVN